VPGKGSQDNETGTHLGSKDEVRKCLGGRSVNVEKSRSNQGGEDHPADIIYTKEQ
jgi:hypothetical protein